MADEYWKSSPFGTDSIFHSSFDEKKLTVKYISCQKDDTYIYMNFDVTAENLRSSNATIYVKNNKNIVLAPLNDIKIGRNGTTSVETKFEISLLQKTETQIFEFFARVSCDTETATTEFRANLRSIKNKEKQNSDNNEKCMCKKNNWTTDDLKYIVTELRKKEVIKTKGRSIRDNKGKTIDYEDLTVYNDFINLKTKEEIKDKLFYFDNTEKLENQYINYSEFSKHLNKTFEQYKINTCLRKVHFMAQIYQETNRFRATYEEVSKTGYSGGDFYQGRGMKQVTHDYNYLEYYCDQTDDSTQKRLFNLYMEHRKKDVFESVVKFNERTANKYISVADMKKVNDLATKIATDMYHACNAAGWYWQKNKINEFADKDDIVGVSAKVNNPSAIATTSTNKINGYDERYKFYLLLKDIFDYEKCRQ